MPGFREPGDVQPLIDAPGPLAGVGCPAVPWPGGAAVRDGGG